MDESEIIDAIEGTVKRYNPAKYSVWTVGITNDPDRRMGEHGNPKDWKVWRADSEAIARSVEKHFLDKGMKGGGGGGDRPTLVYIF